MASLASNVAELKDELVKVRRLSNAAQANEPQAAVKQSADEEPFRQREALVCALCAYVLPAAALPPSPSRGRLTAAELRSRLESSGRPAADARAAKEGGRAAEHLAPSL